ncbi:MAG: aminoacyl-tRNA hydrolase [Anaerolineaceae bacterium]|nr:aminoacyl-tRNA hydrolase [Anaerolineaceae bacterium]
MWLRKTEQQAPFLIVGLGNPGLEYRYSRHNFGFMVLDALAEHWSVPLKKIKFKAVVGEDRYQGNKVVLAKPLTFMNESGRAVAPLLRFYKCPPENMLVIHDDLDLPLGTLRIRPSGATAGQRGMESITRMIATQEFPRMRLGISRPPGQMDPKDYVLKKFLPAEEELKIMVINQAVEAVECFVTQGLTKAMNTYNGEVA